MCEALYVFIFLFYIQLLNHEICMGQSTISKVMGEVLGFLERKLCPKLINLKMTEEENRSSVFRVLPLCVVIYQNISTKIR